MAKCAQSQIRLFSEMSSSLQEDNSPFLLNVGDANTADDDDDDDDDC